MTRTYACLLFLLAPAACLGDPVSGGATLSGGSGGGSGAGLTASEDGASGMVDGGSTTAGSCNAGLFPFEVTWSEALDDAAVAVEALELRTASAVAVLDSIYGVGSDDPAVLAAHIQAQVASVTGGDFTVSIAPRRCTDVHLAAELFATVCDPGGAHTFTCLGAVRCSSGCPGMMTSDTVTQCNGACWGDCELPAGEACHGTCIGACSAECSCAVQEPDLTQVCIGECTGDCEGICWVGGSCPGECNGVCMAIGLQVDDTAWCRSEDDGPVVCSGFLLDCEGEMLVGGLPPACVGSVGLGTAAATTCAPRPFSIDPSFGADGIGICGDIKAQLREAQPALAELLGVVDHLDLLLGHPGPNICEGTTGVAHNATYQDLQQTLQQQRDALDGIVTLLGA